MAVNPAWTLEGNVTSRLSLSGLDNPGGRPAPPSLLGALGVPVAWAAACHPQLVFVRPAQSADPHGRTAPCLLPAIHAAFAEGQAD